MDLYLVRTYYKTHTRGVLIVGEEVFRTLENPWLDNLTNISCIPAGIYDTMYLPSSGSGKYRKVWWLKDVPGRSGILIHNGSFVRDTQGCILVGDKAQVLGGEPAVTGSRSSMEKLRNILGERPFKLHILGEP